MPFGYQVGGGTPSRVSFSRPTYGNAPAETSEAETNDSALQRGQLAFQGDQADKQRMFQAGQSAADRQQQAGLLASQLGFQGTQAEANRNQERGLLDTNLGFQGTQAWLNRDFQGTQANLQRGFEGEQAGLNRGFEGEQNAATRANQLTIASLPWDYKNKVFGTVSPLLQGLLGGGGAVRASGGGPAGPPPATSGATVWDAGQVQSKINDQKATSAQAAATQERQNAAKTAGQGFGSNSPLLAALNNQTQASRMAGDSAAELATSLGASQANANLGVERDRINAQNYATQTDAESRRRQTDASLQSSLAAALAGLLG